jgi:hypothetical protein
MKKLGIKEIHNFISTDLKTKISERYFAHEILSEADLQSHVWQLLFEYFRENEEKHGLFAIHCNNYFKELHNHPDLVVYRNNKPYIIIELKEWRAVDEKRWNSSRKEGAAFKDMQRLLDAKKYFVEKYRVKRGYFMYVSWEPVKALENIVKGEGARFLFSIRLVNEDVTFSKTWKSEFKQKSKYISKS